MAQARRKRASKKKPQTSHGLGMFFAGIVVGAVATSFFVGLNSDDPDSIGRGITHMISASKNREASTSEIKSEPDVQPQVATQFDFYQVLPEIEQIIPDNAEPESVPESPRIEPETRVNEDLPATASKPEPAPKKRTSRYELQAGSFARIQDADSLKARLALEGLVSKIQKVTIEGRGNFYRVRLGPFEDPADLKRTNQRLAAIGIKALRLKITGGA